MGMPVNRLESIWPRVEAAEAEGLASDKENVVQDNEEPPAKRKKPNVAEQPTEKPAKRLPTLGVKPKKTTRENKEGKPKTISKTRLNALAQPKRRA